MKFCLCLALIQSLMGGSELRGFKLSFRRSVGIGGAAGCCSVIRGGEYL